LSWVRYGVKARVACTVGKAADIQWRRMKWRICEMAPVAQLKCATFLIIYVLYIGTIFTKVKTLNKVNILKRKIFVFIFASKFQQMKYKISIRTIAYVYIHSFLL